MFNVLFSYLIQILTPTRLRKPRVIAFLKLLVSKTDNIYEQYIIYRTQKLYDLNFTGQLMYLQKKLRDKFECSGIIIEDDNLLLPLYLSNAEELNLPVYIGNYFTPGQIYQQEEWIVYLGYWYEYTAEGNGSSPDVDSSAVKRDVYAFYLSNNSEISEQNSFIVKIPESCYNAMSENDFLVMRTIIEYYKLVNKNYTIISY